MDMHVTVCPTSDVKDDKGNYLFVETLYFRKAEDAESWMKSQPLSNGHEVYTVPCIHKGLYIRHNLTMLWWTPDLIEQAEDYAILHDLKIVEFNRSWLE